MSARIVIKIPSSPKELARMLKQKSKVIQSHEESVEVVNLGSNEEAKEVRVGSALQEEIKEKLIKLLKDYMVIPRHAQPRY